MEKIDLSFLNEKYRVLTEKIEGLLDQEYSFFEPVQESGEPFEVCTDISYLKDLASLLPEGEDERMLVLLKYLSHHFEGGIFLKKDHTDWFPLVYFFQGRQIPSTPALIPLPQISPTQILRTHSPNLLKSLNMDSLDPFNQLSKFLIQPTSQHALILMTQLAEPWLPDYLENIHSVISRGMA